MIKFIYGCRLDPFNTYTLNDGTAIDGWTLINVRLREHARGTPFEVLYQHTHQQTGYVLVYEIVAETNEIVLDITHTMFEPNQNLMEQYQAFLTRCGLKFLDCVPTLMILVC